MLLLFLIAPFWVGLTTLVEAEAGRLPWAPYYTELRPPGRGMFVLNNYVPTVPSFTGSAGQTGSMPVQSSSSDPFKLLMEEQQRLQMQMGYQIQAMLAKLSDPQGMLMPTTTTTGEADAAEAFNAFIKTIQTSASAIHQIGGEAMQGFRMAQTLLNSIKGLIP